MEFNDPVWVCDLSDEERVLVEMACGAALAAVYSGVIGKLQNERKHSMYPSPPALLGCTHAKGPFLTSAINGAVRVIVTFSPPFTRCVCNRLEVNLNVL